MNYGLKEEIINKIHQVLAKHSQVKKVFIYGSRAKGNFQPGSDIDLALQGENLTHSILNKISLELDDLLLPYMFDLSIYEQISNPDLIQHIKDVGLIFYTQTT